MRNYFALSKRLTDRSSGNAATSKFEEVETIDTPQPKHSRLRRAANDEDMDDLCAELLYTAIASHNDVKMR